MSTSSMPSLEEVRARSTAPSVHAGDVVVTIGELAYWKPYGKLTPEDGVCFFDGDYRDVLEADDPKVVDALAKAAQ